MIRLKSDYAGCKRSRKVYCNSIGRYVAVGDVYGDVAVGGEWQGVVEFSANITGHGTTTPTTITFVEINFLFPGIVAIHLKRQGRSWRGRIGSDDFYSREWWEKGGLNWEKFSSAQLWISRGKLATLPED